MRLEDDYMLKREIRCLNEETKGLMMECDDCL